MQRLASAEPSLAAAKKAFEAFEAARPEYFVKSGKSCRVLTINNGDRLNRLDKTLTQNITKGIWRMVHHAEAFATAVRGGGGNLCAGVDMYGVLRSLADKDVYHKELFRDVYRLMHVVATAPKPAMMMMEGYCVGAGAGLAANSGVAVAKPSTIWCHPEANVGLPVVAGASFYLNRLPNNLGMYFALTGRRVAGRAAEWAGVATHYGERDFELEMVAENVGQRNKALWDKVMGDTDPKAFLYSLLATEEFDYYMNRPQQERLKDYWPLLDRYLGGQDPVGPGDSLKWCFGADSFDEVVERLEGTNTSWSRRMLGAMAQHSPLALKVNFSLLKAGRKATLEECMRNEYRGVVRMLERSDFQRGIWKVLERKPDEPRHDGQRNVFQRVHLLHEQLRYKWRVSKSQYDPPSTKDVTDKMVQEVLAPLPAGQELDWRMPLPSRRYSSADDFFSSPKQTLNA